MSGHIIKMRLGWRDEKKTGRKVIDRRKIMQKKVGEQDVPSGCPTSISLYGVKEKTNVFFWGDDNRVERSHRELVERW